MLAGEGTTCVCEDWTFLKKDAQLEAFLLWMNKGYSVHEAELSCSGWQWLFSTMDNTLLSSIISFDPWVQAVQT